MPRYYRRRRTVVVKPKKKWASNMKIGTLSTSGTPYDVLVENSAQTSSPTPIIVKAGNFKIQGDALFTPGSSSVPLASLVVVVFYLPEGLVLSGTTAEGVLSQHPEWVMVWKQLNSDPINVTNNSATGSFSISSRLKRNLNSGDKICIGFVSDASSATVAVKYTAQYWTCAN